MADPQIKIKRSSVPYKIPTPDQVPLGELALNTYDGKLFASRNVGVGTTVFAVNTWSAGIGTSSYDTYFTAGNVGIGTTIPTSKLNVIGDVNVTGIITAQDFYYGNQSLTSVLNTKISGIEVKNAGVSIGSSFTAINLSGVGITITTSVVGSQANITLTGGSASEGLFNIDGGVPNSVYGGVPVIDGGGI